MAEPIPALIRAVRFTPQSNASRVFEEDGTAFPVTRYLLPLTHA
ncbi:hypothetical protein QO209_23745 [Pseudomonas citronellolis]|nr:hypothetical protein [Pseudomonas citronellolis]MDN6875464.1 hypothetical protein [Pseudomonas citronellolis]